MLFRWGYSLFLYLLLPLLLLRLLARARRDSRYARKIPERLAFGGKPPPAGAVWVHAVSAGEMNAAAELVRALARDGPLLLTMSTPTGRERALQLQQETGCSLQYLPFDCPDMVARFLNRVRPTIMIMVDTELWPNWVRGCQRRGLPVALVNARMNLRSARGYARVRPLSRPLLEALSLVAVQSEAEGRLFVELGVRPECLHVTGSLKFDARQAPALDEAIARRLTDRCNWVAGSTHPGEEELLLAALRQLPEALRPRLILAPRHVERAAEVLRLAHEGGYQAALFSDFSELSSTRALVGASAGASAGSPAAGAPVEPPVEAAPELLIIDRMGLLASLYSLADLAFIGGSLVPIGGHNMIEAAAWGKPMLMGPEIYKVTDLAAMFQAEGALRLVSGEQLAETALELLRSPALREEMGAAGRRLIARHQGACEQSLALLRAELAARL